MSNLNININGKVVLVTGANRGIGRAIVVELLKRGARKVYAGARQPDALKELSTKYDGRLIPLKLDVTSTEDITNAAKAASDVQVLINNAGVGIFGGFFAENGIETLNQNLNVNVHGLVNISRALIATLKKGDSAAIVNISSVAGLGNMPMAGTYSASKAAVHSITQGFRGELANENILVTGVYPGPIDTDMAKDFDAPKDTPENVAKAVIDGIAEGIEDIYPDPMSTQVGEGYSVSPKTIEKQFAEFA